MSDWQPIETAPKDGTLVLLHESGRVRIGYFWDKKEYNYGKLAHEIAKWSYSGTWAIGEPDPSPTHWMPLPALPKPEPTAPGEAVQ